MINSNAIYFIIFIGVIVVISGCVGNQNNETVIDNDVGNGNEFIVTGNSVVVEMTSNGFIPEIVTISKGDMIVFVNTDSAPHWPASATHPTHRDYPQKGGCIGSAFDACRNINAGENYSFVFHYVGTWAYHDHVNSRLVGKVIVE